MHRLSIVLALLMTGSVVAQQPATNYDEAKVPAYTLPDLLVMKSGARVRNAADWAKRREELRALLEQQMFGRAPGRSGKITFEVASIDRAALDGKAIRKQVAIGVAGKTLNLLLYLPAKAKDRVPVFVSLGFDPNQCVNKDPGIDLAGEWVEDRQTRAIALQPGTESSRGRSASRWPVEMLLAHGYGLATMYYEDIEPDIAGAMKHGIRASYLGPRQQVPAPDEWGAIAAWAWGLSRIADYLATDKDVDAGRLAVVGHSRLGKTALWAGALDTRFALVVSNDSGEGGAAISRRLFGETVADLNRSFPHWFCGNYKQYDGRENEMPFDSHALLALVAPRPLYVASAEEDRWADPRGEFAGAVAASRVYELLGKRGVGTTRMPAVDQPVGYTIGYHVRTGRHDITTYDWEQYVAFADRHLGRGN